MHRVIRRRTKIPSALLVAAIFSATLIVETHTTQRRMRASVERHIEQLARRVYKNPVFVRKQSAGIELEEWQASDASRQIVFAFATTAVIVGNDETSILRAIETRE